MTGVWTSVKPFTEARKDRWLRITWAARTFRIDRATLLQWAKAGVVEARVHPLSGNWEVRELSLRAKLFGSINAGT